MFIKPYDKQGDTALRLDVYALYKAIRDYGMGIVPEDMPYFDRMNMSTLPEIEADDTVKPQAPLTEDELETASHESGAATSRIQPGVQARVDALIDEAKNALPPSPSPKRRRVE